MSEYQFWHGDMRLLEAYKKAYYRNISYNAWYNGMYNRIAVEIGAKNALATKKSERIDRWVDYNDPIENEKPKVAKDSNKKDEEFRKYQLRQRAWLFGKK